MENLILLISILSTLFISSCTKDNLPSDNIGVRGPTNWRVWHDNGAQPGVEGIDYGCWGSGSTCLDDVDVVGQKLTVSNDLFGLVKNGGSNSSISTYLQTNRSNLTDIFSNNDLNNLIAQTRTLTVRGSLSSAYNYFIINNGSIVESVIPVSK